jgi:hypothetical protein
LLLPVIAIAASVLYVMLHGEAVDRSAKLSLILAAATKGLLLGWLMGLGAGALVAVMVRRQKRAVNRSKVE